MPYTRGHNKLILSSVLLHSKEYIQWDSVDKVAVVQKSDRIVPLAVIELSAKSIAILSTTISTSTLLSVLSIDPFIQPSKHKAMCYDIKPPSSRKSSDWTPWLRTHANLSANLTIKKVKILKPYHTWPDALIHERAVKENQPNNQCQGRFLWHGTTKRNIKNITKNGFNFGTWLAFDPPIALNNTHGHNQLILSSVLVHSFESWGDVVKVQRPERIVPLAVIKMKVTFVDMPHYHKIQTSVPTAQDFASSPVGMFLNKALDTDLVLRAMPRLCKGGLERGKGQVS
ncbi:hypothetical protein HDV00_006837 [Rhizophlyctis rosea]|nr:hypothetical protein HDV00_006837 [Rhizophlyctis rosea]